MANYETLADGGHEHLIATVKPLVDQKANEHDIDVSVKELVENQPRGQLTGEILTTSHAYDMPPVSLTVDGKSTQVTTTGKNLLNPDLSAWSGIRISNSEVVSSGGTYYKYYAIPLEVGQSVHWHRNGLVKFAGYIKCCSTYPPEVGSTITESITITNVQNQTITGAENKACVMLLATTNGLVSQYEMNVMQPQFEYGTAFTSFEPYSGGVASPSPDWPQPITSVDSSHIHISGTNILDDSVSAWEVGAMSSIGVTNTNTARIRMADYLPVPSGTYTFSVSTNWHANVISIFDRNKVFVTRFLGIDTNAVTFTVPEDDMYVRIFIGKVDESELAADDVIDAQPQLVVGSTATTYEPYDGTSVLLNLTQALRSLPDGTKDTLALTYLRPSTREGWAWYSREVVQYTGETDLGTLNWTRTRGAATTDDAWKFGANIADRMPNNSQLICTDFARGGNMGVSNVLIEDEIYGRLNTREVMVRHDAITDGAAFKTFVTGAMLVYKLATPVTIELDPIELPVLPAPECTVWSDPSTGLQMEYVRDTNIAFAQLEAALADLATS